VLWFPTLVLAPPMGPRCLQRGRGVEWLQNLEFGHLKEFKSVTVRFKPVGLVTCCLRREAQSSVVMRRPAATRHRKERGSAIMKRTDYTVFCALHKKLM